MKDEALLDLAEYIWKSDYLTRSYESPVSGIMLCHSCNKPPGSHTWDCTRRKMKALVDELRNRCGRSV